MSRSPAAPKAVDAPSQSGLGGDFRKFLFGQTVSNLGSSFTLFALPLLVFELTGSALNLALVTVAGYLPYLFFGLLIGAEVNRTDRKRLMILTGVAQAAVIASIPLAGFLGVLSVWWVYAAGFATSTLWVLFNTAEFAAVPSLVSRKDLGTATGRIQASYSAATVAGPLLAGLLASLVPLGTVLLFDALSFLVSAASLALIGTSFDSDPAEAGVPAGLGSGIAQGLRYVLGHPVLRNVSAMMALVNCVGFTVYAQLVLFAKERLEASDAQVGLLYSAGSVGMIALALAASPLRRRLPFSEVALGAIMVGGPAIVLLSLTREFRVALALWALVWGLLILFQININSLWQTIVPNCLLGRVQSIVSVLSWSAILLGTFVGGVAIERTRDVALVYGAIGVLIFLIALGFSLTSLGRAERYLPRKERKERRPPS